MAENHQGLILITGGNGFIGSHVAKRLHERGCRIRIADIAPTSSFPEQICTELLVGNLCDQEFCRQAVYGVDSVLHFAATMGGMGTIHSANDFPIYTQNQAMTVSLISAALAAGVKTFFYASSACVYPESLQSSDNGDHSLRESDVWADLPPTSQGLYGLEKLVSECLLRQYSSQIKIRIARFHNIYGPGGAWNNGREKAPAALLRKAISCKLAGSAPAEMELWGDGSQRRSFLWIADCVDAILRLVWSDCDEPLNVGSEQAITIKALAELAIDCAGVDPKEIKFMYDLSKPVGVASRNSNNDKVREKLGWAPTTSLETGMRETARWVTSAIQANLVELNDHERSVLLKNFQRSQLVHLQSDYLTFALLLPITSRGLNCPEDCLDNLVCFARSLAGTTWRDTHEVGGVGYRVAVYLAIDDDDEFLREYDGTKAESVLRSAGIVNVVTIVCSHPRGHVCSLWRDCARRAWEDGCDYLCLVGDDVVFEDEGWMRDVVAEFTRFTEVEGVPMGFGCVAFTDTSFPGMPTFPVLHRTHLDIFSGEVVPDIFINQDGDPYLFQLYRRWGCSTMMNSRIKNKLGGSKEARYEKQSATDWTYDTLDNATRIIDDWTVLRCPSSGRKLTLDVIVPCYRVQLRFLDHILQLQPSPTCTTMFIIIIDNPSSAHIIELQSKYGHRPDVRIRVNARNLGASASRNRGLRESAAEWVHFLDDDVTPRADLLIECERAIRTHPSAAGFVGNTQFPPATTVFTTAVHLAGVTYFWDIATKIPHDVPWGVTANLVARRNVNDGVRYDTVFPKTGGGEDIDFCLKKHQESVARGGEGFWAAPEVVATHPWWNDGRRSYRRFYLWSKGDGALIKMYPELSYRDAAFNGAEQLFFAGLVFLFGLVTGITGEWSVCKVALTMIPSIVLANVAHDWYRHLWRDAARTTNMNSTLSGLHWFFAVVESTFIRLASEGGRLVGVLERGEIGEVGRRFDWFVGRSGSGPRDEERRNSFQRLGLGVAIFGMLWMHVA